MKVGVVIATDEPARLYAAAAYMATELARGNQVVAFVTGRAVLAFAGRPAEGPDAGRLKEAGAHWEDILEAARPLGLRVLACEAATKAFSISPEDYRHVDAISTMYSFLEEVGDGRLVAF